jgi:hypothetical protein
MANASSTSANDTSTNNSDKDNDHIIKISNNKDLRLKRLVVPSCNTSNKEYTLHDEYKVIADDMKS